MNRPHTIQMHSQRRQRGSVVAAVVGGVVALALIIFGVMYFGSDVWRTKIDQGVQEFSKWTPDNIAKDPIGYLNFAEKQAKETMQKLKANEISVGQRKAKLLQMKEDHEAKIAFGQKTLDELKALYKQAEQNDSWPVEYNGQPRDREWVKRNIVQVHAQVDSKRRIMAKVEASLNMLDNQVAKINSARTKAQEQLVKIDAHREELKVQQINEQLATDMANIQGTLAGIDPSILTSGETGGPDIDLDSATPAVTVDDSEFEAILAQ